MPAPLRGIDARTTPGGDMRGGQVAGPAGACPEPAAGPVRGRGFRSAVSLTARPDRDTRPHAPVSSGGLLGPDPEVRVLALHIWCFLAWLMVTWMPTVES